MPTTLTKSSVNSTEATRSSAFAANVPIPCLQEVLLPSFDDPADSPQVLC